MHAEVEVLVAFHRMYLRVLQVTTRLALPILLSALLLLCPRAGASEEQSIEGRVVALFRAGQEAMQAGDYDQAVKEFYGVLRLNPVLVEARANLGLAFYTLGEYNSAVTELTKVVRERPSLAGSNLFLGLSYLKLSLPEKAIPSLKRVLLSDRSNLEARRALASCYLAQSRYREAAREFRTLFDLQTGRTEGWYQLGKDYLKISTQLAALMASEYRESAWTHRLAGDVLAFRESWKDAVGEYSQALEVGPEQAGLRVSLGLAYLRQGELPEAEAAFLEELQRDPHNERALLGLLELSLVRGDTTSAFGRMEQLLNVSSDLPTLHRRLLSIPLSSEQSGALADRILEVPSGRPTHLLLALLYKAASLPEKAEEYFQLFEKSASSTNPGAARQKEPVPGAQACRDHRYEACAAWIQSKQRPEVSDLMMLGRARLGLNQLAEATEAFGAVLAAGKDNIEVIYWLVRTYQTLADESFRRVEELSPDSWRVHQLRGEAHKLRQAHDKAVKELRLAIQLRPNEPELYESLGHTYLLKSSYEEAKGELERALQLDPSRARALFLLGRLLLNQREEEKAVVYLQKALRRDPSLLEAHASLGTAYRRMGQAARAIPALEKAVAQDFYGDLNYQLYLAYRDLRKEELAQKALARSQELRRSSVARYRARIFGLGDVE